MNRRKTAWMRGLSWYISGLWQLHKRLVYVAFKRLCERLGPTPACKVFNCYQFLKGRNTRFEFKNNVELFIARNSSKEIFFSEKMRGFWLYAGGIEHRGNRLIQSYFLDQVTIEPGDVVIDCGANYGDLYLGLREIQQDFRYISFEPSDKEHACVKRNAPGQQHYNCALWEYTGELELFISAQGADSSAIKPKNAVTEIVLARAIALDELPLKCDKIKLLKLEAEGGEPEILRGAITLLQKIEFIAADGGAERGVKEETTIEYITNFLLSNNFELLFLDVKSGKGRALFRNRAFTP